VLADQVLLAAYAKQMRPVRPGLIELVAKQLTLHGQARPALPPKARRAGAPLPNSES
jgi:hypothetical protein